MRLLRALNKDACEVLLVAQGQAVELRASVECDRVPAMATEAPPDLSGKKDFLLKEYESLRKEIEWMLTDIRALERNVLVAVGVTWAWLFTHKDLPGWAWLFPCLFVALGCVRVVGMIRAFGHFREYITKIEGTFLAGQNPMGWEHFSQGRTGASSGSWIFWTLLIATTLLVAFVRGRCSVVPFLELLP